MGVSKSQKIKIIVAHPGQHKSLELAAGLKKQGCLFRYITTVYDKKDSLLMRILRAFMSKEDVKRLQKRKSQDLKDEDVLSFYPLMGLMENFIHRLDKSGIFYQWWHSQTTKMFGKRVARYAIKHQADVVITYDTNAKECFRLLTKKAPKIIKVLELVAVSRLFMKKVYEEDIKRSPQFADKLAKEVAYCWDKNRMDYYKKEIDLADYYIATSTFVKKSLEYSGAKPKRVFTCYYGSNVKITPMKEQKKEGEPLSVLYVGNVTQLKGIAYLLEGLKPFDKKVLEVNIVGKFHNENGIFDQYLDQYHFTGQLDFDKVSEYYKKADVFLFPTLGDGFGMVVLEAMSYGLPIICSENAGGADAIKEGENGFIIPAGDSTAITEKINWFLQNRDKIHRMGLYAQESSRQYTWENYIKQVVCAISQMLQNHQGA